MLNICTKHPDLIYSGISEFTPLGQVGTDSFSGFFYIYIFLVCVCVYVCVWVCVCVFVCVCVCVCVHACMYM